MYLSIVSVLKTSNLKTSKLNLYDYACTLLGHQVTPDMIKSSRRGPKSDKQPETQPSAAVPLCEATQPSSVHVATADVTQANVAAIEAPPPAKPYVLPPMPDLFDDMPASSPATASDFSYVPSQTCTSSTSRLHEMSPEPDPLGTPKMYSGEQKNCHKEPKYIIFESCLKKLVKWCHCPSCGSVDVRPAWDTEGTQLNMTLMCESCDKRSRWNSQPNIGSYAAGNILLSAGILFAGATAGKVLRVLNSIGVVTYSKRTFFHHQTDILHPAIKAVWDEQQRSHLTMLQVEGRPLVLGGDGRADSPGYSAKFGTYTTMELEANVVLDLQVVQVSTLSN